MKPGLIQFLTCCCLVVLLQQGCGRKAGTSGQPATIGKPAARVADPIPEAYRVILVPIEGESPLDKKIARAQMQVRTAHDPSSAIEQLGWLFVSKARGSFDPGFYKLAEQCAACLEARQPSGLEALLLRGHVLHNLHRFKEAEPLARELTTRRGAPFDFGLLGDVLMEQGKLAEAIPAYQKMIDLRPDLHSYSRAAHVRWLKGDVSGAIELMRLAVGAASPLDAESAAWVHTRLAAYEFQSGAVAEAERDGAAALEFQRDYPPALLLRGRMFLAQNKNAEAIESLRRAAELNPLPEYQWTLAEALRADHRPDEAEAFERGIEERGAMADPRTVSVYLATRGRKTGEALRLARAEFDTRADVFTHDALAWSLAAGGQWKEAGEEIQRALAEGTQDARLFFHAGMIAAALEQPVEAEKYFERARNLQHLLLPSERTGLRDTLARIGSISSVRPAMTGGASSPP